jgi:hypothetical protein
MVRATGKVAKAGEGANRVPMIPAIRTINDVPAIINAYATIRRHTCTGTYFTGISQQAQASETNTPNGLPQYILGFIMVVSSTQTQRILLH